MSMIQTKLFQFSPNKATDTTTASDNSNKRKLTTDTVTAAGTGTATVIDSGLKKSKKQSELATSNRNNNANSPLKVDSSNLGSNARLIDILLELGNNEKSAGEKFKSVAYYKAVSSIKSAGFAITSGEQASNLLPGIGKKIAKKIDEILTTGELARLTADQHNPRQQAVNELTSIHGIGAVFAAKLVDEYNINSIAQLQQNKYLLNTAQLIGLQYVNEFQQRIPRTEMELLDEFIQRQVELIDPTLRLTICGSYRRGASSSGDIDCLLTSSDWITGTDRPNSINQLMNHLTSIGFITDELGSGSKKFMGVCQLPAEYTDRLQSADENESVTETINQTATATAGTGSGSGSESELKESKADQPQRQRQPKQPNISTFFQPIQSITNSTDTNTVSTSSSAAVINLNPHRRIDIRFIPSDSYACALCYFTGSDQFNVRMRQRALELGFTLNEYKLTKLSNQQQINTETELDLFRALDWDYIEPNNRN